MGVAIGDGAQENGRAYGSGLPGPMGRPARADGPEDSGTPLLARGLSLLRDPDRGHALTLGVTTDTPLRSKVCSQVIL
jgi:hypothetical protein